MKKQTKNFTQDELHVPKHRAEHIRQLPTNMRFDVLSTFENMAEGGDGGGADLGPDLSIRSQYYRHYSNQWFQDVIEEYRKICDKETSE